MLLKILGRPRGINSPVTVPSIVASNDLTVGR
jgi:hypothetical protein